MRPTLNPYPRVQVKPGPCPGTVHIGAMDLSLAVLIVLVAGYAGAVTWFARGLATGAAAAVGVLAAFALILGLAHLWLPGAFIAAPLVAATITYLTLAADLSRKQAVLTAVGGGLVVGAAFVAVSYLAMMALIGAAGIYLVLRRWLRTRPALLVMGGALGTFLAGSAAVFLVAIANM
jgi:hypothetical protein